MSNDDTLEKLVSTSSIGGGPGGGYLSIDQADVFIDHIFKAAVLWNEARTFKMNAPYAEWPTVRVGARIVRGATEGVDTGQNANASFTKVSITVKKLRLDWEVSTESLEDNIEGQNLDQHLLTLFTSQLGNDLEELSVHGDEDSTDPLLKVMDGWHKQALAKGHVRVADTSDPNSTGENLQLSRTHFNQAFRAMPRKYRAHKEDLRFYASDAAISEYLFSRSTMGLYPNETIVSNELSQFPSTSGAAGWSTLRPFGVQLREVPVFDSNFNESNAGTGAGPIDSSTFLEFTAPKNRLIGIQRNIQIMKQYSQKKDTFEYTCYVRFGLGVQDWDNYVTITGIPIDETLT